MMVKAYLQKHEDETSNKKLVWMSQLNLSAADYNILISDSVMSQMGFQRMECLFAKHNTVISKGELFKWR